MDILNIKTSEDLILTDDQRNPLTTKFNKDITLFGIPIYSIDSTQNPMDKRSEWQDTGKRKPGF